MRESLLVAIKTKKLGRVCKVGAWTVLGLGIIEVVLNVILVWQRYSAFLAQLRLDTNQFGGPPPFDTTYELIYTGLISTVGGAIFPIFIFVVLYVAGTIFTTMAASAKPTSDETDDIVYEPLTVPAEVHE